MQILDPVYHLNAGLAGYTQVLAALLGAGFKDDFAKRVKIQSYDLKARTRALCAAGHELNPEPKSSRCAMDCAGPLQRRGAAVAGTLL